MDLDNYCELTSQLDARDILRYLNELGIRNITGEVLQYFITDLKKLIKYDLQHKNKDESARTQKSDSVGLERLHSASTFSSRIRSRAQEPDVVCNRQCHTTRKLTKTRTIHSAPSLGCKKEEEKNTKRACSCVRVERKPESAKESQKPTVSGSLIKVPKQPIKRKSDPVSLYHYYTSLWAKYKPNVPGENNWSDLRWNIRQKMVGNGSSHNSNKIKVQEKQEKVLKSKTPVD